MNGQEVSVQAVKKFDSDFDIQRLGATLQRGTARQSFPPDTWCSPSTEGQG